MTIPYNRILYSLSRAFSIQVVVVAAAAVAAEAGPEEEYNDNWKLVQLPLARALKVAMAFYRRLYVLTRANRAELWLGPQPQRLLPLPLPLRVVYIGISYVYVSFLLSNSFPWPNPASERI